MPTFECGWGDCRAIQDLLNRVGSNISALKANIGEFISLKEAVEADSERKANVTSMLNHLYSDYKYNDFSSDVEGYATLKDILDESY